MSMAVLAAIALGGCGTITRGTTEQVTFNSEPPGARVQTSLGHTCPETPCTFEISRKSEFIASFSLPGYEPIQVPVITKVNGEGGAAFAGNLILGGIVGMAADASTGAAYDHEPNPVVAQLRPLRPLNATRPKAQRQIERPKVPQG